MTAPPSGIPCPVCQLPLTVRLARGRKSRKSFIHLVCPRDGCHFRAFINDQQYVRGVLVHLEGQTQANETSDGVDHGQDPSHSSGAVLERSTRP